MDKVQAKVIRSFLHNGVFLEEGKTYEFNLDRAVNHMRVGDLERNEQLIDEVKAQRAAKAQAMLKDTTKDW